MQRGHPLNGRRFAMLLMALAAVPIVFVPALGRTFAHNAWLAALVMPFALSFQKENPRFYPPVTAYHAGR